MNKIIIMGYNEKSKIEVSQLKNKIISNIKRKEKWVVITDIVFGNLIEFKDYAKYLKLLKKEKFESDILKVLSNTGKKLIGIKIPDKAFSELAKINKIEIDATGKCIKCDKFIREYEEECINKIDNEHTENNVFVIINDIHLRNKISKEYGNSSYIFKKFNSVATVIRPVKRSSI